jgi:transposase
MCAFTFFNCVAKYLVPDNLKSAVTKAHIYDPDINQTFTELSEHYNVGVLPARPIQPKDKTKVENSVLLVQRWILARLRNQTFHSREELNRAIWRLLEDLNNRKMQVGVNFAPAG